MSGNPVAVLIIELDVHRLAAIGAAGAVDNLKLPLAQFTSQFIGIKTILPMFHAAEKLAVLPIMTFGVLPPVMKMATKPLP